MTAMRMRDLAQAAGLPRTTIHHYLREGLLPEPERTATNAATYGPEHLERLRLLKSLRGPELGPLSVEEIRGVLELVERGYAPAEAVGLAALGARGAAALQLDGARAPASGATIALREVAQRTGREVKELRQLVDAGLLLPREGRGGAEFDGADVAAAVSCARLVEAGIEAKHLEPLAELLREVRNYEGVLENLVLRTVPDEEADAVRTEVQNAFRDLHLYLLSRLSAG
jgi:DNA-binding transcriptional MerR regulator